MLVIRYLPPSTSALGGEQVWRKAVEQRCSSLLAKKLAIMIFFFFFFVFSPLFQSSHFPALWGTASRWDLILQNPEKCFLAILQHLNAVWIVFGLAKKKKLFQGACYFGKINLLLCLCCCRAAGHCHFSKSPLFCLVVPQCVTHVGSESLPLGKLMTISQPWTKKGWSYSWRLVA